MTPSHDSLLKGHVATSIKLTGKNYLLWSQAYETFLSGHRKIRYIIASPSDAKDATYEDWFADDCAVISWMLNSMDEGIARSITMLKPAKKIWDTL